MHDNLILYLIATPIGNLGDISSRALTLLAQTPIIAAEDTRLARKLLQAHGIYKKKIISLRAHNENAAAEFVIKQMQIMGNAAYVADAGAPAISDPGAKLAKRARLAGITVSPIPGASALTCLLSAAGVEATETHFFGFAPRPSEQRRRFFAKLRIYAGNVVLFESPKRMVDTVRNLRGVFGDVARVVIGREMTKRHEQIVDLTLAAAEDAIKNGDIPLLGEFTIIIESPGQNPLATAAQELFAALAKELPPRRAAQITAHFCGGRAAEYYRQHVSKKS